ncbi:hypothetical protein D3C72_2455370 [compost metagenome]
MLVVVWDRTGSVEVLLMPRQDRGRADLPMVGIHHAVRLIGKHLMRKPVAARNRLILARRMAVVRVQARFQAQAGGVD